MPRHADTGVDWECRVQRVKNELQMVTECIFCADRYVVVRVGNLIIANVGTSDRRHIVEDVLQDIWSWRLMYPDRSFIIGGDFNSDINKTNEVSCYIQTFLTDHCLARCDARYPDKVQATYVNESLGHCSQSINQIVHLHGAY